MTLRVHRLRMAQAKIIKRLHYLFDSASVDGYLAPVALKEVKSLQKRLQKLQLATRETRCVRYRAHAMVSQIHQRLADLRKMGGIKCTDRESYTGSLPAGRRLEFKLLNKRLAKLRADSFYHAHDGPPAWATVDCEEEEPVMLAPGAVTPFLEYFQPDIAVEDVQLQRCTDASELFFAALVPAIAAGDSQRAALFSRPPSRWQSRRRTGKKRVTARQRCMRETRFVIVKTDDDCAQDLVKAAAVASLLEIAATACNSVSTRAEDLHRLQGPSSPKRAGRRLMAGDLPPPRKDFCASSSPKMMRSGKTTKGRSRGFSQ
eukprot:CAMPEP_0119501456 /NCGR_PEP_ID=MMETSP1344-20130328/23281_1 /TAXON_ID=236787 /ORGANISM="Florenciella parvula, Strain CCMP2471" /LENGTH=316 /DNA_ID=CAMNT_0007537617 /DNA_START=68 /DNA_END=1018 /DNA_ORIENTATION=-